MNSDQFEARLTQTSLRRRNGRKQACEPCRRRKVACDHSVPVCQRCRRRNTTNDCVYLPQEPSVAPSRRIRSRDTLRSEAHVLTPSASEETSLPNSADDTGYLGATSFSAVFEETRNTLASGQASPTVTEESSVLGTAIAQPRSLLSQSKLAKAVAVLKSIPDKHTSYILFRRHVNPNDGWCRLAGEMLLDTIWTSFGRLLGGERCTADLTVLANKISSNSSQSLKEDYWDPEEWFQSFSGESLRWEALGILFTYWSLGTLAFSDSNALGLEGFDRKAMFRCYKENAWACAELVRDTCASNGLLLYLLYKHSLLEGMTSGDASLAYWRLHADMVAVATFLGLHTLAPSSPFDTSISAELNKRLFAAIFNIDKVVTIFTGRPPLLSRRYCTTPLPLDIDDESLLGRTLPLMHRILQLDHNGWNEEDTLYSTTILRVRTQLAYIRDAIMEFALGNPTHWNRESLAALRSQQSDIFKTVPRVVIYRSEDIQDPETTPPILYTKLLVRLEQLQNLFFIERLCQKIGHEHAPSVELLNVSLEMVSLTLIFWTHQDQLSGFQSDFEWLVMSLAAPASGILCMGLLNPSQSRIDASARPKRSQIVQKLSLLVGFLDWVKPTAPNGGLCGKVKSTINSVLEEALDPSDGLSHGQQDFGEGYLDVALDLNEYFNFELLDTFDWLRPSADVDL